MNLGSRKISVRRSLMQVKKKWSKCCPDEKNTSDIQSCSGDAGSQSNNISNDQLQQIGNLFKDLSKRVAGLELKYAEQQTPTILLEEFEKLKKDFENAAPFLEKIQQFGEPIVDFMKINPENCNIKINVRTKSMESTSGDDEESDESDEINANSEINWIKESLLKLSESLKLQSENLELLKSEDIEMLENRTDEISELLEGFKAKMIAQEKFFNSMRGQVKEIEGLKAESKNLQNHLQDVVKSFATAKEEAYEKMESMKADLEANIKNKLQPFSSEDFGKVVGLENLEKSSSVKSAKTQDEASNPPGVLSVLKGVSSNRVSQLSSQNSLVHQDESPASRDVPRCPQSDCACMQQGDSLDIYESLNRIQKQVSAHKSCLQELIGDITTKLDRCEFDECRCQLNNTIEMVMKLKRDQECPPTAAGGVLQLMPNVNCMSCQAATKMTTMESSAVPRSDKLNFARNGSDTMNFNQRSLCQHISNRNWSSYNRKSGGSHTKLSRAMAVREMRFKRLKTPSKVSSSILICNNRFRRGRM